MKVLKFIALFLPHSALVTGGVFVGSFGMYALLSDDSRFAGVSTVDAVGTLLAGLLIAMASFAVTPRRMGRVIK